MRSEIVEAMQGLNKIGVAGDDELRKTTMRMLGRDAVLAGYFNVATNV